jgi:secreted trypsin-like serine protease
MAVEKVVREPLCATLVGALVAAIGVSFFVFVRSGEAVPRVAADEQPSSASVSPVIVGGTKVPDGKYPFMAYIDLYRNGKLSWSCGGSLLDRDSVLTAAHCLANSSGAHVVVGRTDRRQKKKGQARWASRPFIHSRYNPTTSVYDVGVLKLKHAITGIQPIKLATAKQNNLEKPGHILTAAGWGVMKQPKGRSYISPKRMRKVSVPVVSDSRAKRAYQSRGLKYFPSLMVATSKKGKSPCFGDSGGPLFDSGSRTQVGITSGGVSRRCGLAHYPVVYTEVNNPGIRNWILWAATR